MKILLIALCVATFPTIVNAICWRANPETTPLEEAWDERVTDIGILNDGRVLRVYQNAETGSWSITVITDDIECVWTSGDGWRSLRQVAGQKT